jgi:hypothetical protein
MNGMFKSFKMPAHIFMRPKETILPYINPRTGILKLDNPTVQEMILANYSIYSYKYWLGVRKRQALYLKNLYNLDV